MRKCPCNYCKFHDKVDEVVSTGSREQLVSLVWEIYEMYSLTDEDLHYEKAIADGSWPNAVEILEKRLENAKNLLKAI